MPPQAAALPEEILEQIFLRLPPDEPACLMRGSLTSKLWLAHLSGARFRGIYCEFHGSPPMLGFIYHLPSYSSPEEKEPLPLFVSTTKFSVRTPNNWGHRNYQAWDCHHGRVLLVDDNDDPEKLIVWDPMTDSQRMIHLPTTEFYSFGAAVLCAVAGCDHRACQEGPFQVIFFGLTNGVDGGSAAYVSVYFQETGEWSEQRSSLELGIEDAFVKAKPPVLIENTLYLIISDDYDYHLTSILSYNLASNCLSEINAPQEEASVTNILIAMEDGILGFANLSESTLNIWSRKMGSDRIMAWKHLTVISIHIESPIKLFRLVGSVEGSDIIFLTTILGIYEINLKLLWCKKLWKTEKLLSLIPYMNFYSPQGKSVLAKKGETL